MTACSRQAPGPMSRRTLAAESIFDAETPAGSRASSIDPEATPAPGKRPCSRPSPAVAQPRRDAVDGQLDPTQQMLAGAARPVLLQELDLDVVQRIQIREPVAYRAIEQRIVLQELAMIHHGKERPDRR